jgi:hypothetical protein
MLAEGWFCQLICQKENEIMLLSEHDNQSVLMLQPSVFKCKRKNICEKFFVSISEF